MILWGFIIASFTKQYHQIIASYGFELLPFEKSRWNCFKIIYHAWLRQYSIKQETSFIEFLSSRKNQNERCLMIFFVNIWGCLMNIIKFIVCLDFTTWDGGCSWQYEIWILMEIVLKDIYVEIVNFLGQIPSKVDLMSSKQIEIFVNLYVKIRIKNIATVLLMLHIIF